MYLFLAVRINAVNTVAKSG